MYLRKEFKLIINGAEGHLTVSESPQCEFNGDIFNVKRRLTKSSWGMFDFSYRLTSQNGKVASGSTSAKDGQGVDTSAGYAMEFNTDDKGRNVIGANTIIEIDREKMIIDVETSEPEEHFPAVILGIIILADPQGYWESLYKSLHDD